MSQKDRFPPTPDHGHEYEALLRILVSVLGDRRADYVSSPLTGGPRFVEWFQTEGRNLVAGTPKYRERHNEFVVRPNIAAAREVAERLRLMGEVVIEPTSFDSPHWTQNDYRHLWGLVIQRHVKQVFLVDGWEFSSGCAYEYWIAASAGIETVTEDGTRIEQQMGIAAVRSAMREMQKVGISTEFAQEVWLRLSGRAT